MLAVDLRGAAFHKVRAARRNLDKSSGVKLEALAEERCQLGKEVEVLWRPGVSAARAGRGWRAGRRACLSYFRLISRLLQSDYRA